MQITNAIKALSPKTDWAGLLSALVALHAAKGHTFDSSYSHKAAQTVPLSELAGVRDMRFACESAANWYGRTCATRSVFIAPSPETLAWGGFLGGETVVVTDDEIEAACDQEVLALIATFR